MTHNKYNVSNSSKCTGMLALISCSDMIYLVLPKRVFFVFHFDYMPPPPVNNPPPPPSFFCLNLREIGKIIINDKDYLQYSGCNLSLTIQGNGIVSCGNHNRSIKDVYMTLNHAM